MLNENNTEMTDEQVNELYDSIQSAGGNREIPMEGETPPANNENPDSPPPTTSDMFELNGQQVSREQLLELAGQASQSKPLLDKYSEVDKFAIENPEWWEHVQKSYSERDQNAYNSTENVNETPELSPELQQVQDQLTELKSFMQEFKTREHSQKVKEEDTLLEAEITSIKEQYPYLDFSEKGDDGLNIEGRVLKHAQQIKTESFRAAFRDLMHEKLVSKAQELGRDAIGKEAKRNTKLGILGTESKQKVVAKRDYHKSKSYDDLLREELDALREI